KHHRAQNVCAPKFIGDRLANLLSRKIDQTKSTKIDGLVQADQQIRPTNPTAAGSPNPQRRTSCWSPQSLAPASLHASASAESTPLRVSRSASNSYAHGAADHVSRRPNAPSAPTPEPPAAARRTPRLFACSAHARSRRSALTLAIVAQRSRSQSSLSAHARWSSLSAHAHGRRTAHPACSR